MPEDMDLNMLLKDLNAMKSTYGAGDLGGEIIVGMNSALTASRKHSREPGIPPSKQYTPTPQSSALSSAPSYMPGLQRQNFQIFGIGLVMREMLA